METTRPSKTIKNIVRSVQEHEQEFCVAFASQAKDAQIGMTGKQPTAKQKASQGQKIQTHKNQTICFALERQRVPVFLMFVV